MKIRYLSLVLLGIMGFSGIQMEAKKYRHMRQEEAPVCSGEAACLAPDSKCQCYCAAIGDFRTKNETDKPIFIAKDVNEKYCYCKQWDYDNYPYAKRPSDQVTNEQKPRERRRK